MTDGDRKRHLTSVWMRKDTKHSFYILKKNRVYEISQENVVYLESIYKNKIKKSPL